LLDRYVELLKNGEVVAFPTETVYGLGADAWNPDAIKKVFETKGRPSDNPLIVHISNVNEVENFAADIPADAQKLMKAFWPGPLTLIFRKKPEVLDIITAGLDTVALRWPNHPLSQDLIAQTGPLVAPSANSSGRPSPTRAEHVQEDFGKDFPVIEAGETNIGLESTVLDITSAPYRIYRPGAVSAEEIAKVTGKKVIHASQHSTETSTRSPGTKYSHYAPDALVQWLTSEVHPDDKKTLYLLHSGLNHPSQENIIEYDGDYHKMAHELYDRFRQADHRGYNKILIEPFSDIQLKKALVQALQNRINKAVG